MKKLLLTLLAFVFSLWTMGQTTYFSKAAATDFNTTSSWGTGTDGTGSEPSSISNADIFVVANGASMTLSAPASVRALYIGSYTGFTPATATGTLTIAAGNSLTVSKATGYNTTLGIGTSGTLTITGGTLTLNGNFAMTSGNFNQSGGSIILDGNDNNTAASSVASGTHLFSISGGTPNCTAGTITIVDPPCNTYTAATTRSINISLSQGYTYFSGTHTFILGDGISTTPGNADGFTIETYASGYAPIMNLTVNAGNGTGRYGSTSYSSSAYGTHIMGTLTINSSSEFRVNPTSTAANSFMVGSIVNDGIFTTSRSSSPPVLNIGGHASLTGYTPASASSITGSGVFRNLSSSPTASYASLVINNALGVSFGAGTLALGSYGGNISGTLTMTNGVINTNGQTLILGVSTSSLGTLSYTAGSFSSGSSFGRWYAASTAGTTITAGAVPSFGTGSYPFLSGTNSRHFHIYRPATTGATGGVISVTYTDGSGLTSISTVADGSYNIDRQSAAYWTVSTSGGFAAGTGTFSYAVSGQGIYSAANTNGRLMKVATVVGTHQAGTTLPHVQRTAVAAADFTGAFYLGLSSNDIPINTAQSGKWEDGSTWVGGVVPSSAGIASILSGHTVTVDGTTGSASIASVLLNAGGALTVSGGTLTIGTTNYNNSLLNYGAFTLSGGVMTVNGNIFNATGSSFTQSGGTITIDGNNGGSATGSVASGTPLLGFGNSSASFATGTVALTGGTLIIKDPHTATTNTNGYALYGYFSSGVNFNASTSHTIQFGDGSSTDAGGHTSGFYFELYAGSGRLNLGNVTVDAATGTNRIVTQASYTNAINGNLTVTTGTFSQGTLTTNIGGNISVANGATMLAGGTTVFCLTTGTTAAAQTVAQSVSVTGTGAIQNLAASPTANFASINIQNTSSTGVTFNALNTPTGNANVAANVLATITFNGRATTSGKALLWGTAVARGTGSLTITSGGMTAGSTFAVGTTSSQTGTTITAGSDPSFSSGGFPFKDAAGNNRYAWVGRVTPTAAGIIACTYTDASGTSTVSIADGAYTVNTQLNGNWTFSTLGTTPSATTFNVALSAPSGFYASNGNSRVTYVASVAGTHQNGTTSPTAQRTGLTLANLTSAAMYMGINSTDIPFVSVTSGAWDEGTTWNKGTAPTGTDNVTILSGHTVTVNAANGTANAVTINSGGILTVSGNTLSVAGALTNNGTINASGGTLALASTLTNGGTLNVSGGSVTVATTFANNATFTCSAGSLTVTGGSATGITNAVTTGSFTVSGGTVTLGATGGSNRTFTNSGTLTVSSGTLNVNGNLYTGSSSVFNQSGGNINIDGNAAGVAGNSSTTYLLYLNAPVNWTGGTLTIVDPSAATSSTYTLYYNASASHSDVNPNHTIVFGDGVSSDAGGNAVGFYINNYVGSYLINFGSCIVNGPGSGTAAATNRMVTTYYTNQGMRGNLTINNNGEWRNSNITLAGNLTVNSGGILTSTGTFSFALQAGTSAGVNTSAQTLTNSGTIQNLAASPTANFTSITVNNNNATGVTLNSPVSLSGTLTLTAGFVNTTATNILKLGTATAAGTLSGGSATACILGPFARTYASARTASGTYNATTLFPVGKGTSYLPIYIDPTTTTGAVVFSGEAFTSNSGSMGSGVTTLSADRWEALAINGSTNLSNCYIRLTDASIISGNAILQSTGAAGSYTGIPGASTYAAGPPVTLTTGSALNAAGYYGYFAYGNMNPCSLPTDQPTDFAVANLGSVGFNGSWTAALSAPSNYLVVRYAAGASPKTDPSDYVNYSVGSTLGTSPVGTVRYAGTSTSFTETGLAASTSYDYYVYSFNNNACFGPIYNRVSPLFYNVTTCATSTAPGTPTLTAGTLTQNSFTAEWSAASPTGGNYYLDVATNGTFTSFVSGYNNLDLGVDVLSKNITGLSSSTTYYVRVKSVSGSCHTTYSATLTQTTLCDPISSFPYSQDFNSVTTPALPTCFYQVDNNADGDKWITYSTYGVGGSICAGLYTDYNAGANDDYLILPQFALTGNQQLRFSVAARSSYEPNDYRVVLSTTDKLPASFTTVLQPLTTVSNTTMTEIVTPIDLSAYTGNVWIAIHVPSGGLDGYYLYVDNIIVEARPSCPKATALTAVAYGHEALLGWTGPTAPEYQIEYGATAFTQGTGTKIIVTSNPYALGGLTPSTGYSYFVRSFCSVGDTSVWSDRKTFTTTVSCPAPTTLVATAIQATTANLGWTETGLAHGWGIEYGPSTPTWTPGTGAAGITRVVSTSDNPYAVSSLTANTAYTYYVRAICGAADTSAWSSSGTFTTACAPATVPTTVQDFSGATFPPDCWSRYTGLLAAPSTLTTTTSGWIQDDWRNVTSPVNKAAKLNIWSTSTKYWLVTPPVNLGAGDPKLNLEFDLTLNAYGTSNVPGYTGVDDKFAVVISTDGGNTWTSANTLRLWNNSGSTYVYDSIKPAGEHVTLSLGAYTGVVRIGFYGESTVSNADNDLMIDNVILQDPPSCLAPTVAATTDITNNSATIHWTEASPAASDGYNWEVRTSGAGGSGATGLVQSGSVAAGSTYAPVTGLSAATTYYVYVQGNCGTYNGNSAWAGSGLGTFTTLCNTYPVPYTENFDAATTPNIPACWTRFSSAASRPWLTQSTTQQPLIGAYSEPNFAAVFYSSTYAKDEWLVSPGIELTSGVAYRAKFMVKAPGWDGVGESMAVTAGTDPSLTGIGAATEIWSNTNIQVSSYTQMTSSSFTPGTTGIYYFAWHANSVADLDYIAMDDIIIEEVPTCLDPTDVAASMITMSTASINWTAPTPAPTGGYNYEVRTSGAAGSGSTGLFTSGTTAAGVTTFDLTGLTSNTTYYIYVQSNCGIVGTSPWASGAFNTLCGDFSLPFTEAFETTSTSINCWSSYDVDGAGIDFWGLSTSQNHTTGGARSAYHSWGDCTSPEDGWLVTPALVVPAGGLDSLSFWSYSTYPSDYGKNSVLVATGTGAPDDPTYTEIWTPASVTASWVQTKLSLSSYAGQTIHLAFRYEGTCAHGWYLDDVSVENYTPTTSTLNVTAFLEGLYNGASGMNQAMECLDGENTTPVFTTYADTLTVALAENVEPNYSFVHYFYGVGINPDGTLTVDVPGTVTGDYFVVLKHRNSVETWSALPVTFPSGTPISLNWTLDSNNTYGWDGGNEKPGNGISGAPYVIYSGEVSATDGSTPPDGYIDGGDVGNIFNLAIIYDFGYKPEDLTGDGFIDGFDVAIVFNNATIYAGKETPQPGKHLIRIKPTKN